MYLTCQDLAHSRCLIFPESVNTWVELLWVFYLETSIPKEEEKEEKGRGRGEEGRSVCVGVGGSSGFLLFHRGTHP